MEWLVVLLAGGAASYAGLRLRALRLDRRERAEELAGVIRLAEEDVTVLGEQLARLGTELAGADLDDAARQDYQTALDAYERAKWDAPRLREPEQISTLTDTLSAARYAIACVRARASGEPVPARRVPCFFNPQHGPSARDVEWTPRRGATRTVPACVQCRARVAAHEQPEVRVVRIGSREVPYWEAGAAYFPYTEGYFAGGAAIAGVSLMWAYTQSEVGSGDGGFGGGVGPGGGFDGGGFDGGGLDAGFDGGGFD